jgi:predicted RNA-binding Zn ribbon-like protein
MPQRNWFKGISKDSIALVFDFIGWNGPSAVDPSRQPMIRLNNPADLASWVWDHLEPGLTATEDDCVAAWELRADLRRLTHAHISGEPFAEADCNFVNAWAAKPSLLPVLVGNGIRWKCPNMSAALAHIAYLGVRLLGESTRGQIRKCGGCNFLFFDSTGRGNRHWCSMNPCGNRAKVNGFNRRRRGEST